MVVVDVDSAVPAGDGGLALPDSAPGHDNVALQVFVGRGEYAADGEGIEVVALDDCERVSEITWSGQADGPVGYKGQFRERSGNPERKKFSESDVIESGKHSELARRPVGAGNLSLAAVWRNASRR